MKTILIVIAIAASSTTKAQSVEVQQLLLNYEKLTQLKNILTDMKKGYEIVSKGYTTIKNISEGNFHLHDAFISGLLAVNPAIKNYKRVPDIITHQKNIVKEYRQAFNRFKNSGIFSSSEIDYLGAVYANLFNQSLQNLDELATVITTSKLSMSDDERLEAIDRIFADTENKLQFLRDFNRKTNILVLQRTREKKDIEIRNSLYQVNQ
ncbi:TerB family tellurite resistance protein [Arcticibacter sp. MXS-1]|uniref:TerB family tellurite resistance protein n=1 Tax=Arcticibacter sp. MXS-1 TaxID=3341726 RepID=UPI0035A96839